MRLSPVLAILALLVAQACAYDVSVKVTVSQGTLAVGTNVTIVKDGVLLYMQKVGPDGLANFQLDGGSYFVLLDRGGYERFVSILEVNGTTNVTRTMTKGMSYASVYGQIMGPTDFSEASVALFSDGKIAKREAPNRHGYYIASYLPAGEYLAAYSAPGFAGKNETLYMPAKFTEKNVELAKVAIEPAKLPALAAPGKVNQSSVIEISLFRGAVPMAGESVVVQTPGGIVVAIIGSDGKARVNAVKSGAYVFTYGSLTATTVVEGESLPPAPSLPPQQGQPEPQAPPQQTGEGGVAAGLAVAGIVALILVAAAAIFLAAKMGRKKHKHSKK